MHEHDNCKHEMHHIILKYIDMMNIVISYMKGGDDFSRLKITIRIAYKYKQINVPNLVYFGSPSIASYNDYSTISINLHI